MATQHSFPAEALAKAGSYSAVMPGLVPGIHVFLRLAREDADGRDEPGHDGDCLASRRLGLEMAEHDVARLIVHLGLEDELVL
jgi:hypothetical protein